jgi:hypothetical protein
VFLERKKAEQEFLEMLVENSTWIRGDDRWRDVKRKLESDARYNLDILSSDDREDLFEDFVRKLRKEKDASKQKKQREDDAQRDRERDGRRQKEREERLLRERQEKMLRDQEVTEFKVLLKERLHDTQVRRYHPLFEFANLYPDGSSPFKLPWQDARKMLEKDRRFDTKILTSGEKEDLFNQFVGTISTSREREFLQLLESSSRIQLNMNFEEVKPYINGDKRYAVVDEETRERVFDSFAEKSRRLARDDLVALFKSVAKITPATPTKGSEWELVLEMLRVRMCSYWELQDIIADYLYLFTTA